MRLLLFLCLSLSLTSQSLATENQTWVLVEGPGGSVLTPQTPETVAWAQATLRGLEIRRQLLGILIGAQVEHLVPRLVVAFPDPATAAAWNVAETSAQTSRAKDLIITWAIGVGLERQKAIFAESSTLLVESATGFLPAFLRDGLFQLLQHLDEVGGQTRLLPAPRYLELLRARPWLSMANFSELSNRSLHPEMQEQLHAQMWALFYHFVVVAPERRRSLVTFIDDMRRGGSTYEAFPRSFGKIFDELLIDARAKVLVKSEKRRLESTSALFTLELAEPRTTTLQPLELFAHQGLFFAELRVARAFELCTAGLAAAPSLAKLCLGRIAQLESKPDEARRFFQEAVAHDEKNGRAQFFLAQTLTDLDARIAALRAATRYSPMLGEAWAELALALEAALDKSPPHAEDVALALEAHQRLPMRSDVTLALYRLYQAGGLSDQAERLKAADGLLRFSILNAGEEGGAGIMLPSGDNLDPALTLAQYQALRRTANSPEVAADLDAKIAELSKAAEHNFFVKEFGEIVGLFNAQDFAATNARLEALLPKLVDEENRSQAGELLIRSRKAESDRQLYESQKRYAEAIQVAIKLYSEREFEAATRHLEGLLPTLERPEDRQYVEEFLSKIRKHSGRRNQS